MNTATIFPLITLQPAVDASNAWVALLLEGAAPIGNLALERMLREFGLAQTIEVLPCVIPVEPLTIDAALAAGLPPGRCILRIPVAAAVDPAQHAMLAALQEAGFGLIAAGFPTAAAELFPGIASLAVACPGHSMPKGFGDWLRQLPGPHLALGTTESVCPGFCKFHWLAGHLAEHAPPHSAGDPTARSLLLRLLSLVMADADADVIEALVRRDPNLSYHLLKLVNSVAFAPIRKIDNFNQAIALLGRRQLQRWLQLLLYVRSEGSATASPLLPLAAKRASLMESLAKRLGQSHEFQGHAFIVGMFSLLDVLFAMPLAELVAPLNLPDDVVGALAGTGGGMLNDLLAVVIASEGGAFPPLAAALATAGVSNEVWAAALVEAVGWAAQVSKEA